MDRCGLPRELFTPTFAVSRVIGWCANIAEQAAERQIIRPAARYVGRHPRARAASARRGEMTRAFERPFRYGLSHDRGIRTWNAVNSVTPGAVARCLIAMSGVIDGRRWLRQRIQHLEAVLSDNPPPEQRPLLEADLAAARAELRRSGGWRRWLWWEPSAAATSAAGAAGVEGAGGAPPWPGPDPNPKPLRLAPILVVSMMLVAVSLPLAAWPSLAPGRLSQQMRSRLAGNQPSSRPQPCRCGCTCRS